MSTEINEAVRKQMGEWGKKGGDKTSLRGKEYFSKIGKEGMSKRWANHVKKQKNDNQKEEIKAEV